MPAALRFLLCVAFVVATAAVAQQLPFIKQDTTFPVELRRTIHTNSAKVGDPVEFRTIEPVLVGRGIVVPNNASLLGEIEEVQPRSASSPESSICIRVRTLRWNDKVIPVNAVVTGVFFARAGYLNESASGTKPTFLEGIRIVAHLSEDAFTEFSSSKKEVVLRNGILLLLRQVDPDAYRSPAVHPQLASRH
jgi:hypothetical protein